MAPPEFSIPVPELDAAGKDYHFVVRAAWMRGALEGHEATASGADGKLDVRVSKSGNDVVVRGTLTVELTSPCARCLEPAHITIDETISVLMVPAKDVRVAGKDDQERELSSEGADVVPYEGETVVLDELVRDELVLETPMIPLCSEDCPGISPDPLGPAAPSSQEKPIDPRLMPLFRLKNRTKE